MKKIKTIVSIILASAMLGIGADAADVSNLEEKADVLHRLGLINGVDQVGFNPGLGMACTREQAVATVLRVTGNIDKVYAQNFQCSFSDVSEWAKPYVAYGESIGLCKGITDEYFGAMEDITLRQLCTMYLRMLGYSGGDADIYETALAIANPLGMCKSETDRVGTRSDLIDISYNSLYISTSGGATALVRYLTDSSAISLYDITQCGDDGLLSAYYASEPVKSSEPEIVTGDVDGVMSYDFSSGAGVGMALTSTANVVDNRGEKCASIGLGRSISFKLSDECVSTEDKYFTLNVKYFDSGVDKIRVAYNVANMPYCSGYIAKTGTNTWKEAQVVIRNAKFTHAQDSQGDISIFAEKEGGIGTAENIAKVTLIKQKKSELPVNPLEVEPVYTTAFISFDGMGQSVCLTQLPGGNSGAYNFTEQASIGGESCVALNVGKRLILNLDDDFIDPDEYNCQIKIRYFDNGTEKIRYSYSTEDKRYKDMYIQKTGTDEWKTYTVNLTDASFMNRQDGGVDFSIWGVSAANSQTGSEKIYIGRVEITKQ